jgi:hypothetical protein
LMRGKKYTRSSREKRWSWRWSWRWRYRDVECG